MKKIALVLAVIFVIGMLAGCDKVLESKKTDVTAMVTKADIKTETDYVKETKTVNGEKKEVKVPVKVKVLYLTASYKANDKEYTDSIKYSERTQKSSYNKYKGYKKGDKIAAVFTESLMENKDTKETYTSYSLDIK